MQEFFHHLIDIFIDMSIYILVGLVLVGIFNAFVNKQWIRSQIGKNTMGSTVKAALFGIPLPLCSCGVVPTAVELKKEGASNGAVVSFLISTPHTGIESIVATYGIMGWFMTVFRPVAALLSGIFGGTLTHALVKNDPVEQPEHECECGCHQTEPLKKLSFKDRLKKAVNYSFGEFLDEISLQFILGIFLSALVSVILPDDFFVNSGLNSGILAMLMMAVLGVLVYVCSVSSIPIALSLILKGLSPAAAFVFLFVGPAINLPSITVYFKMLGKKITAIYISSVIACALLFGWLFEILSNALSIDYTGLAEMGVHEEHGLIYLIAAGILGALLLKSLITVLIRKFKPKKHT